MTKWLTKELVFKLDFEKDEYEVGWVWIAWVLVVNYPNVKMFFINLF